MDNLAPLIGSKILKFKTEPCNCNSFGPAVADKFLQTEIMQLLLFFHGESFFPGKMKTVMILNFLPCNIKVSIF